MLRQVTNALSNQNKNSWMEFKFKKHQQKEIFVLGCGKK